MQLHPPIAFVQKYFATVWAHINDRNRTEMLLIEQIALYAGIPVGVYLCSNLKIVEIGISQPLAAFIALIVTPAFYEKLNIAPNTLFLIRFTFFIQQGVFWTVLCETVNQSLSLY